MDVVWGLPRCVWARVEPDFLVFDLVIYRNWLDLTFIIINIDCASTVGEIETYRLGLQQGPHEVEKTGNKY